MILDIWNERVSSIRQYFKFARTVVLVKGLDYSEYLIFEVETIRYDSDQYVFEWNSRRNLEGYTKEGHNHKFTSIVHLYMRAVVEQVHQIWKKFHYFFYNIPSGSHSIQHLSFP